MFNTFFFYENVAPKFLTRFNVTTTTSTHNVSMSPFHRTAWHLDILRWRIEHDIAYYRMTPLDRAIALGQLETAKLLWDKGARPNPELYRDEAFFSPLHFAASNGAKATLEWCLEKWILSMDTLLIKDITQASILDCAKTYGKAETATFLRAVPAMLVARELWLAKRDPGSPLCRLPVEIIEMIGDAYAAPSGLVRRLPQ